jgi:hypothetical protein
MDDIARVLSSQPGVGPMRIERNDLVVRGGAPQENLFIVDGFEFPTISHYAVQGTGAGSSSVINSEFIKRVDFSTGGFGVRMGDKLSSALSLSLRDGAADRRMSTFVISATQFGMTLEGPAGNASYLVSARRSYLEPVFKAYDMSFAPVYWDAIAKVTAAAGPADKIEVLVNGARDRMQLFNDSQDHLETNEGLVFSDQDMITGGVSWKHYRPRWFTTLVLSDSWGQYRYVQPNRDPLRVSAIDSHQNEASATFDAVVAAADQTELSFGAGARSIRFFETADLGTVPWFLTINGDLSRIERSADTSAMKYSAYAQLSQTFGSIVVNAGVRADYFSMLKSPAAAAPRFSVSCRWPEPFEITLSAGRYYQAPEYPWFANPYNTRLRYAGADQFIAGVRRRFGSDWNVSIEGYRKAYFDYPVSLEGPCMTMFNTGSPGTNFKDFGLDSLASRGTGVSQGVELLVQREISDAAFSGTLSLAYSKTNFTALDGITRPADHDQRFIMNLIMEYRPHLQWTVTGRFLLYTGHPYTDMEILHYGTLAQYIQEYNALRVGVNHSLDVRITHQWNSAGTLIEAFIDIQNVYNRKPYDTPQIYAGRGILRDTGMIGIVPSLGIKVSL